MSEELNCYVCDKVIKENEYFYTDEDDQAICKGCNWTSEDDE